MSTRVPVSTIINVEQTQDPTAIIENVRPVNIDEPITISSFDSSKAVDLSNLENTELYSETIELDLEEQEGNAASTALPRQSRIPAINLTIEGEVKQTADKTVTNITQVINNSYITQKIEPPLAKIGGADKSVQFNFNKKFSGSMNLMWDYENTTLDISGNVEVSNAIFATDISNSSSNSFIVDTGSIWDFTANSLVFPEYTLPSGSGAYGQLLITDGSGNVYWALPESSYQSTVTLTNSAGIVVHDCSLASVFIHNNIVDDIVPNFINLNLAASKSTNILIKLNQGPVAFYIPGVRINGVLQTIKWVNNDLPFGTPLKSDIASFTIINISSTYLIFGQMISFG